MLRGLRDCRLIAINDWVGRRDVHGTVLAKLGYGIEALAGQSAIGFDWRHFRVY